MLFNITNDVKTMLMPHEITTEDVLKRFEECEYENASFTVWCNLDDYKYPKIDMLIPNRETWEKFNADQIGKILERVEYIVTDWVADFKKKSVKLILIHDPEKS